MGNNQLMYQQINLLINYQIYICKNHEINHDNSIESRLFIEINT
jgi:hypothetical protein